MTMTMTPESEDDVLFISDNPDSPTETQREPWRILVVDDDPEVHQVTRLVLKRAMVMGRSLELVDAYSMEECKKILSRDQNFAVILLDVVMETPDAGLQLIGHIRDLLNLQMVRIILRTGQPGYAPELDVFSRYDINDYHAKTELTHARLITAITAALRAYQQISDNAESRDLMARIARLSAQLSEHHSLSDLATRVLLSLVDLFQVPVSGFFVTQSTIHDADASEVESELDMQENMDLRIIAATGRYREFENQGLAQVPEHSGLLYRSLCEAQNICEDRFAVLHLYGDFVVALVLIAFDDPITPVQYQALELFSANLSSAYASAHLFEKLSFTADRDLLTRLSNRQHFIRVLDEMVVGGEENHTLAIIDINHFADLNDGLGQDAGDSLLRSIAHRLIDGWPNCSLARVGGDIFGLAGPDDLVNYPAIAEMFKTTFQVEDNFIPITVTVGLCRFVDAENGGLQLLKSANIALNRAKKSMVAHFEYFNSEMADNTRWRLQVIRELRRDFDLRKLDVWFQPQVDLLTGHVHGMEALIRWPNGTGGFVHPPGVFIPLAEYSGLIVDIGRWVLEKSAETLLFSMQKTSPPDAWRSTSACHSFVPPRLSMKWNMSSAVPA